jgi:hypothetical protein
MNEQNKQPGLLKENYVATCNKLKENIEKAFKHVLEESELMMSRMKEKEGKLENLKNTIAKTRGIIASFKVANSESIDDLNQQLKLKEQGFLESMAKKTAEVEELKELDLCKACYKEKNTRVLQCGHFCCDVCYQVIKTKANACMICRREIEQSAIFVHKT